MSKQKHLCYLEANQIHPNPPRFQNDGSSTVTILATPHVYDVNTVVGLPDDPL